MVISKQKARKKLESIFDDVHDEIKRLAFYESMAYTSLYHVPSGRRLLRYAKKAKVKVVSVLRFDCLVGIVFAK